MKNRSFLLAASLAFAIPAFAEGTGTTALDPANNTNSRTAPQVLLHGDRTEPATAPVVTDTRPMNDRAVRSDDAREHAIRSDDDASERAARKARARPEEEHGGLRNRMHDKKDRARERVGAGRDDD